MHGAVTQYGFYLFHSIFLRNVLYEMRQVSWLKFILLICIVFPRRLPQ